MYNLAFLLTTIFQDTAVLHISSPPLRSPSSIFPIGPLRLPSTLNTYQDERLRGTRARKASGHSDEGRTWQNSTYVGDDGGEWLYQHRHH